MCPCFLQIFEKIQQDELRDEMERNTDLKGFLADQVREMECMN